MKSFKDFLRKDAGSVVNNKQPADVPRPPNGRTLTADMEGIAKESVKIVNVSAYLIEVHGSELATLRIFQALAIKNGGLTNSTMPKIYRRGGDFVILFKYNDFL